MAEDVQVVTPVGRLVQGDLFQGSDKDQHGRPRVDKQGNPKTQYFMALAIEKTNPEWPALWQKICEVAQRDFPGGEYGMLTFAWKVLDGDAPENSGKDGFAGCYVLRCTSGFAPKVHDRPPTCAVITDPNAIKRGYFVRVLLNIRGNGEKASGKPGVYLNHNMVQLIGYGPEIHGGPDAQQVFGAAPGAMPAGMSTTPPAGAMPAAMQPNMPGAPGVDPAGTAPLPGQYPQQPAAMPGQTAPTAPAPDYLHGPQQPATGPVMPGQPAPQYPQQPAAGPVMPGQPAPQYPQQPATGPVMPGQPAPQYPQQPAAGPVMPGQPVR